VGAYHACLVSLADQQHKRRADETDGQGGTAKTQDEQQQKLDDGKGPAGEQKEHLH
jgi:hypothetical protein